MFNMQLLIHRKREALRQEVLTMGGLVAAALRKSIDCLRSQDAELARQIIAEDQPINLQRRMLEQECLVVLAAHQPAGSDLREIGASLEIVSELERIADHAADTARIVLDAGEERFLPEPIAHIIQVADEATAMVVAALAAYEAEDADKARATAARDDEVDGQEKDVIKEILAAMRETGSLATIGTYMLWAVHNYERVGDRATNIAERVVFAATGRTPDLD
jgi:phosphate transport system protein